MDKLGKHMDKFGADVAAAPAPRVLHAPDGGAYPLHRRISEELRRQISAGELRPGDALPSESALVSRFGVSRGTVRQALATLRAEGAIAGSRGRPLVVRGAHLTQPLSELISFSAWARSLGKEPSGAVIEFGPRHAGAEAATALGLRPGDAVYYLVRVRLANDEALMIERATFPPRIGEMLDGLDLNHHSIYAELARRGVVFASARHLIDAIPASRADALLLQVAPRTPLLRVHRHAFSPSGEALEWSDDRYLADRVDFAIENSTIASGVVRRLEKIGGL